ncbi:MAG: tetratricopeptide repeat protein [Proteobacteria bacterium]|nr:tetratricopeptide repeat protein [Pseudomonadota bacterium]
MNFLSELRRRNVPRAAILYAGVVWALAQGISQLSPAVGLPDWSTRWFLIAAAIGFPFWIAFAWFYEFTPQGFKRESAVTVDAPQRHTNARKLDFAIIAVLALAVVLLLTDRFVSHKDAATGAGAIAAIPEKSIAVLPLTNESGEKDQQYFSDGLSDSLINALSQFAGLKVIGRGSSFQFRDSKLSSAAIGQALGVAHLLEGSVQHAGDVVRISATMVNSVDGSTLWAHQYDRPYKDLFALQDDITQQVAGALKARLLANDAGAPQSDRPPGGSLDAWNAYSRGRFLSRSPNPDDSRKAIESFEQAVAADPRYARAYAEMSLTWSRLGATYLGGEHQRQALAKARASADTALQLDPNDANAHGARGLLLEWADFDWNGAEAEYRRALELAPGDGTAQFSLAGIFRTLGRTQQAISLIRQAIASDPRNGAEWYWLGWSLAAVGRLDEAEQAAHKAVELFPDGAFYPTGLVIIQILRGEDKAALTSAQLEPPNGAWRDVALAFALQRGKDRAAADAALQKLIAEQTDASSYQIAQVYALRGDADNTFMWLDRAWANRDPGIGRLLTDPFILHFHDDSRFAAFCKKVGLPTTTDAQAMK